MITEKKETTTERPFKNVIEAAAFLGVKKSTIYQLTHKNLIPFYKIRDRKVYFKTEDLIDFILNETNRVKTINEIESEASTALLNK